MSRKQQKLGWSANRSPQVDIRSSLLKNKQDKFWIIANKIHRAVHFLKAGEILHFNPLLEGRGCGWKNAGWGNTLPDCRQPAMCKPVYMACRKFNVTKQQKKQKVGIQQGQGSAQGVYGDIVDTAERGTHRQANSGCLKSWSWRILNQVTGSWGPQQSTLPRTSSTSFAAFVPQVLELEQRFWRNSDIPVEPAHIWTHLEGKI